MKFSERLEQYRQRRAEKQKERLQKLSYERRKLQEQVEVVDRVREERMKVADLKRKVRAESGLGRAKSGFIDIAKKGGSLSKKAYGVASKVSKKASMNKRKSGTYLGTGRVRPTGLETGGLYPKVKQPMKQKSKKKKSRQQVIVIRG